MQGREFVTQMKYSCYENYIFAVYHNKQDPLFNIYTFGPAPLAGLFFLSRAIKGAEMP